MDRMRGVSRDLRITPRRRQPLRSQLRPVAGVNHIVRHAWMVRVFLKQRIQNSDRFFLVGQAVYILLFRQRHK